MKPNFSSTVAPGADAPKRSMPKTSPRSPTQRCQPSVTPASIASRASAPGRKHFVAVLLRLELEQLPARHRDDARRDPVLDEHPRGVEGERDLGAGGEQDDVRRPFSPGRPPRARRHRARGLRQSATSVRSRTGTSWRVSRIATGPFGAREGDLPGHRGLVRVRRTDHPEVRDRAQGGVVLDRLMSRVRPLRARSSRASTPRRQEGS